MTTSFPANFATSSATTSTTEFFDLPTPPTHWQSIEDAEDVEDIQYQASTEKRYNPKWNPDEVDAIDSGELENEGEKVEPERGMSPTMSLVIGIIIGSFTAMILIVIIVLKVRTGVDVAEYKQEEMQRYQFSSPSAAEREEFGHTDTASTSLIDGKTNVNGNGFFNGGLSTALNSDRARLFKKANSYGRPVREWYV